MDDLFGQQGVGSGCWGNVFPEDSGRRAGALYFALKPDEAAAEQAVGLGNSVSAKHGLKAGVSPGTLHVSLCPVGELPELPEDRIALTRRIADGIATKSFEIGFDRVRTHQTGPANARRKHPLVVCSSRGVQGADLLRQNLIRGLRRGGFPIKSQPTFHMTLFYDHGVVAEEAITPIRWTVRDFVLVHSVHGEGRHILLGQWPLHG